MRNYTDMIAIIRGRIAALNVTHEAVDTVAGLPDGYCSKLVCRPPMRRMSPWTLFLIFQSLGIVSQVVEDKELAERFVPMMLRSRAQKKPACQRRATIIEITPDQQRVIAAKGGKARQATLSLEQRQELGRKGAAARWKHKSPRPAPE